MGVKKAFQSFDKRMLAKSDVVSIHLDSRFFRGLTAIVEHLPFGYGNCRLDLRGMQPFSKKHRSVWDFNPNTLLGEKKPLVFLPKDGELQTRLQFLLYRYCIDTVSY